MPAHAIEFVNLVYKWGKPVTFKCRLRFEGYTTFPHRAIEDRPVIWLKDDAERQPRQG